MPTKLLEAKYWDREWEKWFQRYSLGTPRLGIWLERKYGRLCQTYLELGAGSARESRYLAKWRQHVTCVDFSPSAMELVKRSNPPGNLSAQVGDAFYLAFPDKNFDLSFHKGFWSLFVSSEDITRLFREQLRVTKQYLIILVHNASNRRMVADFDRKAAYDELYKVRFFHRDALKQQLEHELKENAIDATVRLRKFGGITDGLYRLPCPEPLREFRNAVITKTYTLIPWRCVESVVIEVRVNDGFLVAERRTKKGGR